MLVKINPNYKGVYGHYVKDLGAVIPKRAGCEPFEEDAEIARRQISNGVMVAVQSATTDAEIIEPQNFEDTTKDPADMTYPELKAAAKERGISSIGVKKAALVELIREYDDKKSEDTPNISVMEPV